MKAAIYSRKSRFTGKGESIENQIQLCREYGARYLGISADDCIVYEDEGYSGGNTNRPKFQRLLKDARERRFDVLICYRLDRISRNVTDFSQLIKELNRYGVGFVSIREQFDTTTPMGRAMMYIASVFSQLERETIAERIRDNMLQLAKTGRWLGGTTPIGYKSEAVSYVDAGGKERRLYRLVPENKEISLVRLLYEKYLEEKSITGVEKYLAENNIRTRKHQLFHRYSIRSILANPVYAVADKVVYAFMVERGYDVCAEADDFNGINGLIGYNKTGKGSERYRDISEWIISVGRHIGIISGNEWIKVQELLVSNSAKAYRKEKSSKSLLSGILKCGRCGSYMRPKSVQRSNKNGEQVFYYMCELKEKSRKSQCSIVNINGNILDEVIIDVVKSILLQAPPVFPEDCGNNKLIKIAKEGIGIEAEVLKNRVMEVETEIQNIAAAIAKGFNSEVISVFLSNMDKLAREKEEIGRRLELLEVEKRNMGTSETDIESNMMHLAVMDEYIWGLMDHNYKRNLVKSIVSRIIWDGEKLDVWLHDGK